MLITVDSMVLAIPMTIMTSEVLNSTTIDETNSCDCGESP